MVEENLDIILKVHGGRQAVDLLNQMRGIARTGKEGMAQVSKSSEGATRSVDRLGKKAKFVRQVLEAFVLYKGFVFLKGQVELFIRSMVELEHQVSIVQTQLNDLGSDFRGPITEKVVKAARVTGLEFKELAAAEFEVVSANIALADSFNIMELSAMAAVAGGIQNVELAFNAALTQVNAFNLSNRQFGEVFDKQFNLVKRGIFTYEQLGNVIGETSIAFGGMGQTIETSNAALAAISQIFTGSQLQQGATGLKNAVLKMRENVDEFEDFGIRMTDAEGNFRDFRDILLDLQSVLDGLSESARAKVLKDLFDEKRAVRGISVLLEQMPEFEQFLVEQMFAAGDLNDAFETVNDSLVIQAGILKNQLVPAVTPFVSLLGEMVGVANGLNEIMPGLTAAMLQFGIAVGVVGAASTMPALRAGGRLALSRNVGTALGGGLFRSPTGLGVGVAGLGLVSAFAAGKAAADENEPATTITSAMSGAVVGGSMGGAHGAIAGALLGGAAASFGAALDKQADPIAESFAQAFARELAGRSGDIAGSLAAAELAVGTTGGVDAILSSPQFGGAGTIRRRVSRQETINRSADTPLGRALLSFGLGTLETGGRAGEFFGLDMGQNLRGTETLTKRTPVDTTIELRERLAETERQAKTLGLSAQDTADALHTVTESLLDEYLPVQEGMTEETKDMMQAARIFAIKTAESGADAEEAFIRIFGKGADAWMRGINQATDAARPAFEKIGARLASIAEGDFELAADVFQNLGKEGERLADVFRSISVVMQGFETLRTLRDTTFDRTTRFTPSPGVIGTGFEEDISLLEELGVDSDRVANALTADLQAKVNSIRTGEESFEQALVRFLIHGPEGGPVATIPGASNLVDSLRNASIAIDEGLIGPMGFLSGELLGMANELEGFNRLIRRAQIVEEIGRVAKLAGVDISSTVQDFISNMQFSGVALRDAFEDPVKLASLLSALEFGDINVDQSQDFNIVVRVSGDPTQDPQALTAMADALVNEINLRTRERRA